MPTAFTIRAARPDDAAALAQIYSGYIRDTVISFEEAELSVAQMAERVADVGARWAWLVVEREGEVLGYAYANTWKTRSAYNHTVETTIYLRPDCGGQGLGRALYTALFEALQPLQVHAMLACIALPNDASVALHERMGFEKIGHFSEVGRKFGRWLDVGYWRRNGDLA